MKPILVDNCDNYNYQTHTCNKCGRGLPDVCLEFENMKKAAAAYEKTQTPTHTHRPLGATDDGDDNPVASVDTAAIPKRRGRPAKVTA